jgi:hypothetical protein
LNQKTAEMLVPGEGFEPPTFGLQILWFGVDNLKNHRIAAVKNGKFGMRLEVSRRHSTRHSPGTADFQADVHFTSGPLVTERFARLQGLADLRPGKSRRLPRTLAE